MSQLMPATSLPAFVISSYLDDFLLRPLIYRSFRLYAMSFRAQELYKKLVRKVGKDVPAEVMETVKKCLPNNKVVMGRAKRGIFAGRHIQFGNKISEDGGNKSRRTWKPNVQDKRLFSYIHDRHIRIKVTTHAIRCIDKAGGIDEYLLKTPYHKMDTELGVLWKAKVEKMYEEFSNMEVGFFSPEEEAKVAKGFEEYRVAKKDARRALASQQRIEGGTATSTDDDDGGAEEAAPTS